MSYLADSYTFIPAKEVEKREIPEMKKNSVQLLAHAQPDICIEVPISNLYIV